MLRCWHKWIVKEKEVLPSLIEQVAASGLTALEGTGRPSHKPCIVTYRCEQCGAEKVSRI